MSNTAIMNPAAPVIALNRPVMMNDIAEKLGKSRGCVAFYLAKSTANMQTPTAILIRATAKEMGYNPVEAKSYAVKTRDGRTTNSWYGGNFKSHQEEITRMQELRAKGYSNAEIAKAIGRSYSSVYRNIGAQDPELSWQNSVMAAHIRAQKNAARRQYVLNKPIREYNKRVEAHNKMKAEIAKMEAELRPQTPAIEKAAQIKIDFPLVNLSTLQPTALQ